MAKRQGRGRRRAAAAGLGPLPDGDPQRTRMTALHRELAPWPPSFEKHVLRSYTSPLRARRMRGAFERLAAAAGAVDARAAFAGDGLQLESHPRDFIHPNADGHARLAAALRPEVERLLDVAQ